MGKVKQRFNAKARSKVGKGNQDAKQNTHTGVNQRNGPPLIESGMDSDQYHSVLEPNPEIVVVDKLKKEKKHAAIEGKERKILSKKKQKQFDKIMEKKKKKLKRSELLRSLSDHKVSEEELALYQSASKMGQSNFGKRQENVKVFSEVADNKIVIGRKRRKRMKKMEKLNKALVPKKEKEDEAVEDEQVAESESEDSEITTDDEDINAADNEENIDKSDSAEHKIEVDKEEKVLRLDTLITDQAAGVDIEVKNKEIKEDSQKLKSREVIKSPAIYVEVKRTKELQAARVLLPILAEEQLVMETIHDNDVVVLCGETGSGKTTQVPQFLYEAGYSTHNNHPGMIGITEPRRVAATSMSKRVAAEMSLDSSIVSYQIRFEGNVRDSTKIKFMTDGVLLKEMETDFLLMKYSVLIIDEAHERSVFTDILIGLLSRVVPLRKKKGIPIKLIIMSATLRLEDFVENKKLFLAPPPVIKIDSRQYPVTVHFNKKTPDDYVTEAYKKVCKIHRTLKSGGILVFLTGQNEVNALCRKLKRTFCGDSRGKPSKKNTGKNVYKETPKKFSLDNYPDVPTADDFEEEDDVDFEEDGDIGDEDDAAYDHSIDSELPIHVLPLYSLLSSDKQAKVFEPCPQGSRLCVVSTNVSETSLTIPGIKYVVDSGKVKMKCYDKLTGVSSFRITWTSKASANQRAGRAGRVEPGHCYRLYSSAIFQHEFDDYSPPEILRRPADELLLLMKNMGIDKVENFPFPTAPDSNALKTAESLLLDLNALERKKTRKGVFNTVETLLGKTMGKIPVAPRYAKMILLAHKKNCMQYVIAAVAALTVKELFTDDVKINDDNINTEDLDIARKRSLITQARRKWAGTGESSLLGDIMVILRAVGACEFAGCTEKFCKENGLRLKAMIEIRKLRVQLSKAVNGLSENIDGFVDMKLIPPSEDQTRIIRQILLSCLGDRVARKIPQSDTKDVSLKNAYQSCSADDPVFIHPTSALFDKLPEYVVYQEIVETSKLYMKGVTAIDEEWLAIYAPYKCTFSKPLETHKPFYDEATGKIRCYMTSRYGPHSWFLPAQELDFPDCTEKFKWFATAFLEGKVSQKLMEYVPYLLAPATIMTRTWAKLQPRTEVILRELMSERVFDKAHLRQIWKEKHQFLLQAYLQWMPESLHEEISKKWPPTM